MVLHVDTHLMLGGGRVLFVGKLGRLPRHRFAATAVLVGLDDAFDVELDGRPAEARDAAVVGGWAWHGLDFHGGRTAVLFLEPGAALQQSVCADEVRYAVAAALRSRSGGALAELFHSALHLGPYARPVDGRVERLAGHLQESPEERANAPVLARRLGASTSLIEHRFKAQLGVPPGAYRAWHRMMTAATRALDGRSLTEAAHSAGFYDSAHFSRTFHAMFGMPPSAVFTRGLSGAALRLPDQPKG